MAVCVLGSISVDMVLTLAVLPGPGETVLANDMARLPGGKGANQAVAAARMGATTALVGAIGKDEAGDWMRATLAEAGVEVSGVRQIEDAATGAAYIAVDAAAENQIIVVPGANALLKPDMLPPPRDGILLAQLEVPLQTVAGAFAGSKALRILNAAPAVPAARACFADADILVVNEHELALYLGSSPVADAEAALAARALITRPDQLVIVTLGAAGALALWQDRALLAPALPVTPIDTVGAGDCFCGALAALLDQGLAVEEALPLANAAAALATQARGAIPAMPSRAAAEGALASVPTEYAPRVKNMDPPPLS